jgi:hypothetical protein
MKACKHYGRALSRPPPFKVFESGGKYQCVDSAAEVSTQRPRLVKASESLTDLQVFALKV